MAEWQNCLGTETLVFPDLVTNYVIHLVVHLSGRSVSVSDIGKNDWKTDQTRSCDGADYAAPIPSTLSVDEMFNTYLCKPLCFVYEPRVACINLSLQCVKI